MARLHSRAKRFFKNYNKYGFYGLRAWLRSTLYKFLIARTNRWPVVNLRLADPCTPELTDITEDPTLNMSWTYRW